MNAPATAQHLMPHIDRRPVPAQALAELQARFGAQCSVAQAVREQHGRDESAFTRVPPPDAVVFAESTRDVADAVAPPVSDASAGDLPVSVNVPSVPQASAEAMASNASAPLPPSLVVTRPSR